MDIDIRYKKEKDSITMEDMNSRYKKTLSKEEEQELYKYQPFAKGCDIFLVNNRLNITDFEKRMKNNDTIVIYNSMEYWKNKGILRLSENTLHYVLCVPEKEIPRDLKMLIKEIQYDGQIVLFKNVPRNYVVSEILNG